jgi:glycosyltransferase involved in cell wall biosynthesis
VVSEDSAAYLRYAFPGLRVERVRVGLDPALHHPPVVPRAATPGRRQIAYMPRKRAGEAVQVLKLLQARGALRGWTVTPIEGRSERETADLLRASDVFLSFSSQEGFGLPPAEAMACGCLVVGYHGHGGREFFHHPFATAVPDGDVVGFARAVETVLRRVEADPVAARAIGEAGSRFVLERYSPAGERADVLGLFAPLLARPAAVAR